MTRFLSTPSARRATLCFPAALPAVAHFYPRPPRGGRPTIWAVTFITAAISIHALREEGDLDLAAFVVVLAQFLSTPSARRATRLVVRCCCVPDHFYPRPPRGGRLLLAGLFRVGFPISIHALREEGDLREGLALGQLDISIHALREEGDRWRPQKPESPDDFYPRPPRGGRLLCGPCVPGSPPISIHALREEGDLDCGDCLDQFFISIHALREEGDERGAARRAGGWKFLSTPSARRAT